MAVAFVYVVRLCISACDACSLNGQMQEFRTGATRQNMETTHMKEETKRLRSQLGELREKLADLDAKVTTCSYTIY